jgi:hypothetical protein
MKLFEKIFGGNGSNYKYKTTVFFICLSASSVIWLFSKLSETYATRIVIPIQYENMPDGKILTQISDSTLSLTLNDQGFTLFWVKYFNKKRIFVINLEKVDLIAHEKNHSAHIATNTWTDDFLSQFNLVGRVTAISPDTVNFVFEDRFYKKVPVKPDVSISFRKQYFAYDSLQIIPDSVTISGVESLVNAVDHVKTEQVFYNDVAGSINITVGLDMPADIAPEELSAQQVNLVLNVEKYTEAKVLIPVTAVNSPDNLRVRIFPEEVAVSYIVALKDYKTISPEMFTMQVDLSEIRMQGAKKLEVIPAGFPQTVNINRIEPREVEYLILK